MGRAWLSKSPFPKVMPVARLPGILLVRLRKPPAPVLSQAARGRRALFLDIVPVDPVAKRRPCRSRRPTLRWNAQFLLEAPAHLANL